MSVIVWRIFSMNDTFLISAILFLLCLAIRSIYELLKEAHKINLESKPIFVVIFSAMCVLWLSWFSLCPEDPGDIGLPDFIPWLGLMIFIAGTVLAVGALIQLRGVENIKHLVTNGIFKKIRHPMYTGFIFWILGWSLYHKAVISLAIGILGIANVLWWRRLEDKRLEVQFGETYHQYRLKTWF
jgi:protein-S-isoprenylcysteine O-methyltransferase Ste14